MTRHRDFSISPSAPRKCVARGARIGAVARLSAQVMLACIAVQWLMACANRADDCSYTLTCGDPLMGARDAEDYSSITNKPLPNP